MKLMGVAEPFQKKIKPPPQEGKPMVVPQQHDVDHVIVSKSFEGLEVGVKVIYYGGINCSHFLLWKM
jgi:hypothetical protein